MQNLVETGPVDKGTCFHYVAPLIVGNPRVILIIGEKACGPMVCDDAPLYFDRRKVGLQVPPAGKNGHLY